METRRTGSTEDRRGARERRIAGVSPGDSDNTDLGFAGNKTFGGKSKPRKEEAVRCFHDQVSLASSLLVFCGIPKSHVSAYVKEPYLYVSICKVNKWWTVFLKPELDRLSYNLNKYKPVQWERLAKLQHVHADIRVINNLKREVREAWKTRPRFGLDKGRVENEGY